MKTRLTALMALCLVCFTMPALAAKSPACEQLGAKKAAEHLAAHLYAYTCEWDGEGDVLCIDEGCAEYGHLHCYGRQVALRITPERSRTRTIHYPRQSSDKIGPDTQFQLVDVVQWKGQYYAAIRALDGYTPLGGGYVSADYIGCDCDSYESAAPVPEYDSRFDPFAAQ